MAPSTFYHIHHLNDSVTKNNESETDISSIVDPIEEQNSVLDDVSDDEVIPCDINLTNVRGQARIGVQAPLEVSTEATDYINEHVDETVNKEKSTDSGVKIGELFISGDGSIIKAQIEEEYEK